MLYCETCNKNTEIATGWHLEGNLNFCSNQCVAKYLESPMLKIIYRKTRDMSNYNQARQVDEVLYRVHSELCDIFPDLQLSVCGSVVLNSFEIQIERR